MKRYFAYLKYVTRHKFFVMVECFKIGLIWRGLTHDLDKFLPSTFIAYAKYFNNTDGSLRQTRDKTGYYKPEDTNNIEFEMAWFRHSRLNKHHWQYWVMATESGEKIYEIDDKSVLEMLCDWKGAGKAQGTLGVKVWYEKNKYKMRLHLYSRIKIEKLIGEIK